MQTPKGRNSSSEPSPKISPRVVRQLKTNAVESDSTVSSSPQASRTPKEKSPKLTERRSPRSPVSEPQKRRPTRVSELGSQVPQLQNDLKKLQDQLKSSESSKEQAELDAAEAKKQLLDVSLKLEESQRQLLELSASEEARVTDLQKITREHESIPEEHSLASAMTEIRQLKIQLGVVAESEVVNKKHAESSHAELQCLKENLMETTFRMEGMKHSLTDHKELGSQAKEFVVETLLQLETAKETVETLRLESIKSVDAYDAIASELDQSRTRVNLLEGLISKLKDSQHSAADDRKLKLEDVVDDEVERSTQLEAELTSLKAEVGRLRAALDIAESKYHEEQTRNTVQIRNANELSEKIKSETCQREAELEAELRETKAEIVELKANLIDKETELQAISDENEGLSKKLENRFSSEKEFELEKDLKKLKEVVEDLKGNLMDKETELQNILEENEMLKSETEKRQPNNGKVNDEAADDLERAKAAERDALMKLGYVTEEADKSAKRAARVAEQLEAAQAANSEMEAELRRLKVQSDQWRKAAEAAATMLSGSNNGKLTEREGPFGSNYNPAVGAISSPYSEDADDDLSKKKNGNVLKKIGVLWKKPQK